VKTLQFVELKFQICFTLHSKGTSSHLKELKTVRHNKICQS